MISACRTASVFMSLVLLATIGCGSNTSTGGAGGGPGTGGVGGSGPSKDAGVVSSGGVGTGGLGSGGVGSGGRGSGGVGSGGALDAAHDVAVPQPDAAADLPAKPDVGAGGADVGAAGDMGGAAGGAAGNSGDTAGAADGASEVGGTAPVVLANVKSAFAIAIDSTYVYWKGMDGLVITIGRVPKAGGTPTTIYNSVSNPSLGWGSLGAIVVDSTSVYFDQDTCCGEINAILKAAKDGSTTNGAAPAVAQTTSTAGETNDIVADSTTLYFVFGNGIYSVPLAGGGQRTVVDPTGASPVDPVSGKPTGFPSITGMAKDGTKVYYVANGYLFSVPVAGGTPAILIPKESIDASDPSGNTPVVGAGAGQHVSVNGAFVYWTNALSVYKLSVQGGTPTVLATFSTNGDDYSGDAISDGTNVYYLLDSDLWRVPVEGGTPVKVVTDGRYARSLGPGQDPGGFPIAVDDTSVYVVANSLGQIIKVAK